MKSLFKTAGTSMTRNGLRTIQSKNYSVIPGYSSEVFQSSPQNETMENGLQVSSFHKSRSNAVSLVVKTGSRFETEANNGVSFFMNHLVPYVPMSNGKTFGESLENLGALLYIDYSREHVSYTITSTPENIPVVTELLGEMIKGFSSITDENVNKLRSTVLDRKNSKESCIFGKCEDHLHAISYQQGSLGLTAQGTSSNISKMNAKTISEFASQSFTTENMSFASSGVLYHSSVFSLAKNAFGSLPQRKESVYAPSEYYGAIVTEEQIFLLMMFGSLLVMKESLILRITRLL